MHMAQTNATNTVYDTRETTDYDNEKYALKKATSNKPALLYNLTLHSLTDPHQKYKSCEPHVFV